MNKATRKTSPPGMADIAARLARIESRLVSFMKHMGMTSDGRRELQPPKQPEVPK